MVTKREVMGVKERVDSAIGHINQLCSTGQPVQAQHLREVVGRDLADSSQKLDYMMAMAE